MAYQHVDEDGVPAGIDPKLVLVELHGAQVARLKAHLVGHRL
jgi:hypothetical protein